MDEAVNNQGRAWWSPGGWTRAPLNLLTNTEEFLGDQSQEQGRMRMAKDWELRGWVREARGCRRETALGSGHQGNQG